MEAQDRLIAGSILAFFAMLFSAIGVWVNQVVHTNEDQLREKLEACAELSSEDMENCVLLIIE